MTKILDRLDWDTYYLNIAWAVSLRADCRRGKYGVVIVRDNSIVSTGYNGSEPGGKSCLRGECPRGLSNVKSFKDGNNDYSDCISIHAESNAIARSHRDLRNSTIYLYNSGPCDMCLKLIKAAGITKIVWGDRNHGKWNLSMIDMTPKLVYL